MAITAVETRNARRSCSPRLLVKIRSGWSVRADPSPFAAGGSCSAGRPATAAARVWRCGQGGDRCRHPVRRPRPGADGRALDGRERDRAVGAALFSSTNRGRTTYDSICAAHASGRRGQHAIAAPRKSAFHRRKRAHSAALHVIGVARREAALARVDLLRPFGTERAGMAELLVTPLRKGRHDLAQDGGAQALPVWAARRSCDRGRRERNLVGPLIPATSSAKGHDDREPRRDTITARATSRCTGRQGGRREGAALSPGHAGEIRASSPPARPAHRPAHPAQTGGKKGPARHPGAHPRSSGWMPWRRREADAIAPE